MTTTFETGETQSSAAKEASDFVLPAEWQKGRELVQGITIDSEGTLDRDDAIWLEADGDHIKIRVSISDVGSFIDPSSATAQSALEAGESRYLRTNTIPMMPPSISEGTMSLLDGQETPVISISLTSDTEGGIQSVAFSQDRINPKRLTYREVSRLTNGSVESGNEQLLKLYEAMALKLLQARQAKGDFAFYDPARGLMTNEEGGLIQMKPGMRNSGQLIVQEFMIIANTAVGEYMVRHNIPGLFRNHHMRAGVSMEQVIESVLSGDKEKMAAVRQGFGRARYASTPKGHAALNLTAYTHWTSPLRRFADFVNHANIAAHLRGESFPYEGDNLEHIATHLNTVQDEIRGNRSYEFKEVDKAIAANRLAQTALKLVELDDKDFLKVIKMANTIGSMPKDLQLALQRRSELGRIGARELVKLVFNDYILGDDWVGVRDIVLGHINKNGHDAVSVLSYALHEGTIKEYASEVEHSAAGFVATATLQFKDGSSIEAKAAASSKKVAIQIAAAGLIKKHLKHRDNEEFANVNVDDPKEESSAEGQTIVENPKGKLQEFFQGKDRVLPSYTTRQVGGDGTHFTFETVVTITIDGQVSEFMGRGSSKKAAEAVAATKACEALLVGEESVSKRNRSLPENPISALTERSQTLKLVPPKYTFTEIETGKSTLFECTVIIVNEDGSQRCYSASAPNKRSAKLEAAKKVVSEILEHS